LPSRTLVVPILTYHRIDRLTPTLPPITHRLTVDPRTFAAQMKWIDAHHFRAITQRELFDALVRGARLPRHAVLVTFDDGYRDVLTYAAPVIRRLGLHATAHVITERISGGDPSFLTWRMLRALERAGVEIGSHTVSHVELTTLSDAAALHELVASRRVLERRLGHPVQWFAYPFGRSDDRIAALTRRAGYVLAVTTRYGARQRAAHPLELERAEVLDSTGVRGLAGYLSAVG
jgi:peptidoglycan/xylan/chitin deacetylase (PgdA/CDA1 family)